MNKTTIRKYTDRTLFVATLLLFFLYIGIFFYLNMFKYTQHVDSDIAAEALLGREIWLSKDLTPDTWISSTERRVVSVPMVASVFYGITGSMTFSMGLACVLCGALVLLSFAFMLKSCHVSSSGILLALLAICALPINSLINDGQMVPFFTLLVFLFAEYYAFHCIFLFLCITFYMKLLQDQGDLQPQKRFVRIACWLFLLCFCAGLSLGGMRCLQVVLLPLAVCEALILLHESSLLRHPIPKKRLIPSFFIFSLLAVGLLAKLYPTNVDYPVYLQDAKGIISRLTDTVPTAILKCLGIDGNCRVNSFAALMQLGIIAFGVLMAYGLLILFGKKSAPDELRPDFSQKYVLWALLSSFLLTVFIEIITTAAAMEYYFFTIWFILAVILAQLHTKLSEKAPRFCRIITLFVCTFAVCNVFYTYRDCVTVTDNLKDYEEVIDYMDSREISCGYAQFWDASRISLMTDGRITMGHCRNMADLHMYWWLTSTKWYVPNLPEEMPTAYIVAVDEKDSFVSQFEEPVVTLGFENDRFAVYTSEYNLVPMD